MNKNSQIRNAITLNEMTFAEIAETYGVTVKYVVGLYDDMMDPEASYYSQISEYVLDRI